MFPKHFCCINCLHIKTHVPKKLTFTKLFSVQKDESDLIIRQYIEEIKNLLYFMEELSEYTFMGFDFCVFNDTTQKLKLKFGVKWVEGNFSL